MLHVPGLYIGETKKGRSVFIAHEVARGDVIEVCPLIIIPHSQVVAIDQTKMFEYYFEWPDGKNSICLALGYGSLYNHSNQPNAKVIMDLGTEEIIIEAITFIEAGAEVYIDYLDGAGKDELWFEVELADE